MWRQIKWEWGWEEGGSLLQLLMQEKIVAWTGVSLVIVVKSDHTQFGRQSQRKILP